MSHDSFDRAVSSWPGVIMAFIAVVIVVLTNRIRAIEHRIDRLEMPEAGAPDAR